jgi:hypothetical protein
LEARAFLLEALEDPDLEVRFFAARALTNIENTCIEAIPVLIDNIARVGNDRAVDAAQALARLGSCASNAVEAIQARIDSDTDEARRELLASAIHRIRSCGVGPVLPDLTIHPAHDEP